MPEGKKGNYQKPVFRIRHSVSDGYSGCTEESSHQNNQRNDGSRNKKSERSGNADYRNGYKSKIVKSSIGEVEVEVPQNRKSTFEPQVVKPDHKKIFDLTKNTVTP